MKFNVNDIAGIKVATVDQLLSVEQEMLAKVERMEAKAFNQPVSECYLEELKWTRDRALNAIDRQLKELGHREKSELDILFS